MKNIFKKLQSFKPYIQKYSSKRTTWYAVFMIGIIVPVVIFNSLKIQEIVTKINPQQSTTETSNVAQLLEPQSEIDLINQEIDKIGADWVAGETSVSKMSEEEQKSLLGIEAPTAEELASINRRREEIKAQNMALTQADVNAKLSEGAAVNYNDEFDLRDFHGEDYDTPIRDQKHCGSCWAFGAIASLEGTLSMYYNDPALQTNLGTKVDLSEQDLVSCKHPGNGCGGGQIPFIEKIFTNYFVNKGVVSESCFEYFNYTPKDLMPDIQCNVCSSSQANIWKSQGAVTYVGFIPERIPPSIDRIKKLLRENGPVSVGFAVYGDFPSYSGGIYEATRTDIMGYHAVVIVGYGAGDDGRTYWIAKNSWGTGWGEDGYFRIYAGQAMFDEWFAFAVTKPNESSPPLSNAKVLCKDKDGDGACSWGTGAMPSTGCPASCNSELPRDCNDNNPDLITGCGSAQKDGLYGFMQINTIPEGATLSLDKFEEPGKMYQRTTTPAYLPLFPGTRKIKLVKEGYYDYESTIEITLAQLSSMKVTMIKKPDVNVDSAPVLHRDTTIELRGSAKMSPENFSSYTIEWSDAVNSGIWNTTGITLKNDGKTEIENDILGWWDTSNFRLGEEYVLRIRVKTTQGNEFFSDTIELEVDDWDYVYQTEYNSNPDYLNGIYNTIVWDNKICGSGFAGSNVYGWLGCFSEVKEDDEAASTIWETIFYQGRYCPPDCLRGGVIPLTTWNDNLCFGRADGRMTCHNQDNDTEYDLGAPIADLEVWRNQLCAAIRGGNVKCNNGNDWIDTAWTGGEVSSLVSWSTGGSEDLCVGANTGEISCYNGTSWRSLGDVGSKVNVLISWSGKLCQGNEDGYVKCTNSAGNGFDDYGKIVVASDSITSLAEWNGKLYAGTGNNYSGYTKVYYGGTDWVSIGVKRSDAIHLTTGFTSDIDDSRLFIGYGNWWEHPSGDRLSGDFWPGRIMVYNPVNLFVKGSITSSNWQDAIYETGPLDGVDLAANVSLTTTGNIDYYFDCDISTSTGGGNCLDDGNYTDCDHIREDESNTIYIAENICSYDSKGTYTAKVLARRGSESIANEVKINISGDVSIKLNEATGKSCDEICGTESVCTSIGTDSQASDGLIWWTDPADKAKGCQQTSVDSNDVMYDCSSDMWSQRSDIFRCEGILGLWTNCRCASTDETPIPSIMPSAVPTTEPSLTPTPEPTPVPAPTVDIQASSMTITVGSAVDLSWTSANAIKCTAYGDWSGNKSIPSGSQNTGGLSIAKIYTYMLHCTGEGGSISDSVNVTVNQKEQTEDIEIVLNSGTGNSCDEMCGASRTCVSVGTNEQATDGLVWWTYPFERDKGCQQTDRDWYEDKEISCGSLMWNQRHAQFICHGNMGLWTNCRCRK